MEDKKPRQMNERSLENLKLGAQARSQGKTRHNVSLLPETMQWLKGTGNASDAIDALVDAAKHGGLISNNTHDRKDERQAFDKEQQLSDDTHNRIKELEDNQAKLKAELEAREQEISQLRSQLVQTREQLDQALESTPPTPDLERIRESVLLSLRVGKQSAEYKRAKLILDRFIGHYNCRSRK